MGASCGLGPCNPCPGAWGFPPPCSASHLASSPVSYLPRVRAGGPHPFYGPYRGKTMPRTHQDLPEPISDADVQLLPLSHEHEPALWHLRHLVQHGLVRGPDPHLLDPQPNGLPLHRGGIGLRVRGGDRDGKMVPMGEAFGRLHSDISECWGRAMDAPNKEQSLRLN